MRKTFSLNLGSRNLILGERTMVAGVLNITPDSFSDGGQNLSPAIAIERAIEMEAQSVANPQGRAQPLFLP
jgi:dihydropteroate synthase